MGVIEMIIYVFVLLFIVFVVFILIREHRKDQRMKAERAKCFVMISRCCLLIRLLKEQPFSTPTDMAFLKGMIHRNVADINCMPPEIVTSEREREILAEVQHWVSAIREDGVKVAYEEVKPEEREQVWSSVLTLSVDGFAGFSRRKGTICDDSEWIYYMWLICGFIRAMYPRSEDDRIDLAILCNKVERWTVNYNSMYLNEKIRECRTWITATYMS